MIGRNLNEFVQVDCDNVVIAGVVQMGLQFVIAVQVCIGIPKFLNDGMVGVYHHLTGCSHIADELHGGRVLLIGELGDKPKRVNDGHQLRVALYDAWHLQVPRAIDEMCIRDSHATHTCFTR